MRELGLSGDRRIAPLEFSQRETLARLASFNKGNAKALVENAALQGMLGLPWITQTDWLGFALDLFGRLIDADVEGVAKFLGHFGLLSLKESVIAGTLQEMRHTADLAEREAPLGNRVLARQGVDVPWHLIPSDLRRELRQQFNSMVTQMYEFLTSVTEIDAVVSGDRLVEVKMQRSGAVFGPIPSIQSERECFLHEAQVLKLLAVAKDLDLRGVEFALYGDKIYPGWVEHTIYVAERMRVGLKIHLNVHGDYNGRVIHDSFLERGEQGEPFVPDVPALLPPPRRHDALAVEADDYLFLAQWIRDDGVRTKAGRKRRYFKYILRDHLDEILDGMMEVVAGHRCYLPLFSEIDATHIVSKNIAHIREHNGSFEVEDLTWRLAVVGRMLREVTLGDMDYIRANAAEDVQRFISVAEAIDAGFDRDRLQELDEFLQSSLEGQSRLRFRVVLPGADVPQVYYNLKAVRTVLARRLSAEVFDEINRFLPPRTEWFRRFGQFIHDFARQSGRYEKLPQTIQNAAADAMHREVAREINAARERGAGGLGAIVARMRIFDERLEMLERIADSEAMAMRRRRNGNAPSSPVSPSVWTGQPSLDAPLVLHDPGDGARILFATAGSDEYEGDAADLDAMEVSVGMADDALMPTVFMAPSLTST